MKFLQKQGLTQLQSQKQSFNSFDKMKMFFLFFLSLLTATLPPQVLQTKELSVFDCGFTASYCGHSSTNDVHTKATIVILAFANILQDGTVKMDQNSFPHTPFSEWKKSGKKVLLSVGGPHAKFDTVFSSQPTLTNFVTSLTDYVKRYSLDGVDFDLQSYDNSPSKVSEVLKKLKTELLKLGSDKIVVVSPQAVTVYQNVPVLDSDTSNVCWNYFVSIINTADSYIDYYQVQAYNDWYQFPGYSVDYLKNVYLNWRNLQDLTRETQFLDFQVWVQKSLLLEFLHLVLLELQDIIEMVQPSTNSRIDQVLTAMDQLVS